MFTPLLNHISKILFSDKSDTFLILTYIDFLRTWSREEIYSYMQTVLEKHPILKKSIQVHEDVQYFKEVTSFDLEKQVSFLTLSVEDFKKQVELELNAEFQTELQWKFVWCEDTITKKQRLIFSIHHGYTDGYKLIEILTSPFKQENLMDKFQRKTTFFSTLYYLIFGTISIVIMNLLFFFTLITRPKKPKQLEKKTCILHCKSFSLSKIKDVAKQKNMKVNDILYSILVRCDLHYHEVNRNILTLSPINISKDELTNNIMPVFIHINNSSEKNLLLKKVHELFNCFKYSAYIPIIKIAFSLMMNILPLKYVSFLYDSLMEHVDYVYSNIIGPSKEDLSDCTIEAISFVTKAKEHEIIYNSISYNDSINLTLSFQEGTIQDKERFEQCIYKAYEELIS
jgi:hypothetical protein